MITLYPLVECNNNVTRHKNPKSYGAGEMPSYVKQIYIIGEPDLVHAYYYFILFLYGERVASNLCNAPLI
jgi:hypothetical protein